MSAIKNKLKKPRHEFNSSSSVGCDTGISSVLWHSPLSCWEYRLGKVHDYVLSRNCPWQKEAALVKVTHYLYKTTHTQEYNSSYGNVMWEYKGWTPHPTRQFRRVIQHENFPKYGLKSLLLQLFCSASFFASS